MTHMLIIIPGGCQRECNGPVAVHPATRGRVQVPSRGLFPPPGPRGRSHPRQLSLKVRTRFCANTGTGRTNTV